MRRVLGSFLPLLLLAAVSCQSGVDENVGEAQPEEVSMQEWSIVVQSSGGITGRGDGSVSLTSEGVLARTTPGGAVCRQTIEGEVLESVDRAIAEADVDAWESEYFQQGADFFTYTMTLETGKSEQKIVEWNDGGDLPDDLRELWDALNTARQSVDCTETARR